MAMPPTAAKTGRALWFHVESRPSRISRLISRPTKKKKTAISPSLIHSSKGFSMPPAPTWTTTGVVSMAS